MPYSEDEKQKIRAYSAIICPDKTESDLPPLQAGELESLKMWELKELLATRHLKKGGKKAELIERLCTAPIDINALNKKNRLYACRNVYLSLHAKMSTYGDDGMGDKPDGMCRVEYWLAHLNPHHIASM